MVLARLAIFFSWHGCDMLQNCVISAFSTSHASLATDMAGKTSVDDHVLNVVVARRPQSGDEQELLCAIDAIENVFQFGSQTLLQRETSGVDCVEWQPRIRKGSHTLLDIFYLFR